MTIVTWAQHGENLASVTRTFSFRVCDESLTERGCRQARDLAAQLAAGPASGRIVCSPLRRAAQTAAILAEALGTADVTADENLREVNAGSPDGRNDARSRDTYNNARRAGPAMPSSAPPLPVSRDRNAGRLVNPEIRLPTSPQPLNCALNQLGAPVCGR